MSKKLLNVCKALLLPLTVYAIFLLLVPARFGNLNVLKVVLIQSLVPTVAGLGMALGRVTRIFDLSIGPRIVFASMIGGMFAVSYGTAGLVVGCVVASMFAAIVLGLIFRYFRIPSLVVSIAFAMIIEVVSARFATGSGFMSLQGDTAILGYFPYNAILTLLCALLFHFIFTQTKLSYNIRAVGGDELIAGSMGVNVAQTKFMTYVVGSIFVGIAAVLQLSYAGSMSAKVNLETMGMSFFPLMAVIIGGELQNLCGLPLGIFIGSFLMSASFTGLIALGFAATIQDIVLGTFLIGVLIISTNKEHFKDRLHRLISSLRKGVVQGRS